MRKPPDYGCHNLRWRKYIQTPPVLMGEKGEQKRDEKSSQGCTFAYLESLERASRRGSKIIEINLR